MSFVHVRKNIKVPRVKANYDTIVDFSLGAFTDYDCYHWCHELKYKREISSLSIYNMSLYPKEMNESEKTTKSYTQYPTKFNIYDLTNDCQTTLWTSELLNCIWQNYRRLSVIPFMIIEEISERSPSFLPLLNTNILMGFLVDIVFKNPDFIQQKSDPNTSYLTLFHGFETDDFMEAYKTFEPIFLVELLSVGAGILAPYHPMASRDTEFQSYIKHLLTYADNDIIFDMPYSWLEKILKQTLVKEYNKGKHFDMMNESDIKDMLVESDLKKIHEEYA